MTESKFKRRTRKRKPGPKPGTKRDLSGMKNPPKFGPKNGHGGYAELKRYRESRDMRFSGNKMLKAWSDSVILDCNGLTEMDAFQLSMLDRCVECLIILRAMSTYVEGSGIVDKEGSLAPCLRNSYVSYLNSFRLSMQAIYERADKRPPKAPNLDDYLKSVHNEGGSE